MDQKIRFLHDLHEKIAEGKLELKEVKATFTTAITLDGGNATIDCGASGGGIGIVNVRDNAGTILTKINGGDISANNINSVNGYCNYCYW